jgi:peptidoglycan/xylan/chitin deacetylase (PgdA/CDA1 family)
MRASREFTMAASSAQSLTHKAAWEVAMLSGALALALAFGGATNAAAADCPSNPDALGTSRTLVVDPAEHPGIGAMSYDETLPLADKEVVLTFDDGPIPPYTSKILDILASECVKATFFIVGDQVREHPELVRRAESDGHSIGTHSMHHPNAFRALSIEDEKAEIDEGIEATAAALGDPSKLSPFFRFPGFGNTDAAEDYLQSRGIMAWGADITADDWTNIGEQELIRRALTRLEHAGKGILLLHDIHRRTVAALPGLLHELKAHDFQIVHVVAASPEQPKTVTSPQDWLVRNRVPALLLSDLQDLNGDVRLRMHGDAVCEFKELKEAPPPMSGRHAATARQARRHSTAHHADARAPANQGWFGSWQWHGETNFRRRRSYARG